VTRSTGGVTAECAAPAAGGRPGKRLRAPGDEGKEFRADWVKRAVKNSLNGRLRLDGRRAGGSREAS